MRATVTGIALAAVLAVLAAGCGGSSHMSKADYEAKIQAEGQGVQDAVGKISSSMTSMTELAKQVAIAEVAAKKAADELDALDPPADVAADNAKLVLALRTIDAQLKKLAQAAKNTDQVAAAQAATAIQNAPEIKAGQAAVNDMKKKGYKVGVLGG
jgi:uncharacterized protein YukE